MSTTAVTAHPERRRRSIPLTAIGLLWALVAAGPFVFLLLTSFKDRLEILVSEVWALPQDPSLANYRTVLENDFLVFLRNSVVVVTLSVVLIIVVSAPAAYVFARFDFPFRTPLFTLVVATTFLPSERLSPLRAAGLLLGFLGVVIVIGPWDSDPLTSSIPGQLACLGAACCYGIAFVYTRRFITGRHARPEALAAGQLMAAAAILLAAAPFVATDPVRLDPVVVGSVLTLGLVATGLAYVLYYRLITEAGATSAAMVTYLIPVVAVTLGYLVLDEPVGWNLFAGAAVVILGVAMAEGRLTLRSAGSAARARSASPRRPSADPRRRSGPGG